MQHILVVTYGRSGSTLVTGLLNAMPGVLVRGENGFFLLSMFDAWQRLTVTQDQYGEAARRKGSRSAFYGIDEIDRHLLQQDMAALMDRQLIGSRAREDVRLLGFKEVRWNQVPEQHTEQFFQFVDGLMTGCLFIVHRRAHEDVRESGFWRRQDPVAVDKAISRIEQIQDHLTATRGNRVLATSYERLVDEATRGSVLRDLQQHVLGQVDPAVTSKLEAVARVGHGPRPFGRSRA